MIPINSSLENKVQDYIHMKNELEQLQFSLGGNWDYEGGSFDKFLDDARTVWLRIPFVVTQGELDGEATVSETRIQVGKPFVLRHLYQDGMDDSAEIHAIGALVDQFQTPTNRDASVSPEWVEKATVILKQVEQLLQ